MTIYVDRLQSSHLSTQNAEVSAWCHMATDDDDLAGLHEFARLIGLPPEAFHSGASHPHYDLGPRTRAKAVALGAIETGAKELVKKCFRR